MGDFGNIGLVNPNFDGSHVSAGTYFFTPTYEILYVDFSSSGVDNVEVAGVTYNARDTVAMHVIPGMPYNFDCIDDLSINGMLTTMNVSVSRVQFTTTEANYDVCVARNGFGTGPMFVQWETTSGDGIGFRRDVSFIPSGHPLDTCATHTFTSMGIYDVSIAAEVVDIKALNNSEFTGVSQIGNMRLGGQTFKNSALTTWTDTNAPQLFDPNLAETFMRTRIVDLSGLYNWELTDVTDLTAMFQDCSFFDGSLGGWNVGGISSFFLVFAGCKNFNQPLGSWQTGVATTMNSMFDGARSFDQDISGWDVTSVTDMTAMFRDSSFNQPLRDWDMGTVEIIDDMFSRSPFNQDISGWNVTAVTAANRVFLDSSLFNSPVIWDDFNPNSMTDIFNGAITFDQDLSAWSVGSTLDMCGAFHHARSFNHPFRNPDPGKWLVVPVTNTSNMFNGASSFNQPIHDWSVHNVVNMNSMFRDASVFNQPLADWSVTRVTDMGSMFRGALSFGHDISGWHVSNEYDRNVSYMFSGARDFSGDLSRWFNDASNVQVDMQYMFHNTENFNSNLTDWQVNGVTSMRGMFEGSNFNNGGVKLTWEMHQVTDMAYMFKDNSVINVDLAFDLSVVTDATGMFKNATAFNGDIEWGTGTRNIEDFQYMFQNATAFDGDLTLWNIDSAGSMAGMFEGTTGFATGTANWTGMLAADLSGMFRGSAYTGSTSGWNTQNVTNMNSIFRNTTGFTGTYLNDWSVGAVVDMGHAFEGAIKVAPSSLTSWDVSSVTDMTNMFSGAVLFRGDVTGWAPYSCTSFGDQLFDTSYITEVAPLFNWEILKDVSDTALGAIVGDSSGNYNLLASYYHPSTVFLVPSDALVVQWELYQPETFVFGLDSFGRFHAALPVLYECDVSVSWGPHFDTLSFHGTNDISYYRDTLAYSNNTQPVTVFKGDISGWNTGAYPIAYNSVDVIPTRSLLQILQCGSLRLAGQQYDSCGDFENSTKLIWSASDSPDMAGITSLSKLFKNCTSLATFGNGSFSEWDVSAVTSMSEIFRYCDNFDGNSIEYWDVSNVNSMTRAFNSAYQFNGDISSWNVSNVTDMGFMFTSAHNFNRDLYKWNVGLVENMDSMFNDALNFNGDVTGWEPIRCTTFDSMFEESYIRDGKPLLNWLVGYNGMDIIPGETYRDQITGSYNTGYSVLAEYDIADLYALIAEEAPLEDIFEYLYSNYNRIVPVSGHVMRWEPSGDIISMPIFYESDVSIAWGDNTGTEQFINTSDISHTYVDGILGDRTIVIRGDLSGWNAGSGGLAGLPPADKLKRVAQLGCDPSFTFADQSGAFANCTQMDWTTTVAPDIQGVQTLAQCFLNCASLTDSSFLSFWSINKVTTLDSFLDGCTSFNGYINWAPSDLSLVSSMNAMFRGCAAMNGNLDISSWQTGKVVDMSSMFEGATYFNTSLRNWDVTKVTTMNSMFRGSAFDGILYDWSVNGAVNMAHMFRDDTSFNQSLASFVPESALTMNSMFRGATNFRNDITNWDVRQCTDFDQILDASYFQEVNPMLNWTICGGDISDAMLGQITADYSGGYNIIPDHADLDTYRLVPVSGFVTYWEVSGYNTTTLPILYATDVSVAWGTSHVETESFHDTCTIEHVYARGTRHAIVVRGTVPWDGSAGGAGNGVYQFAPKDRLLGVLQCGTDLLPLGDGAFTDCNRMQWTATDAPNLHDITSLDNMFRNCASLTTPNFNSWDVSGIQSMHSMFISCSLFDGCINEWNTTSLETATDMFNGCISFNGNINDWSTGSLANTVQMFQGAQSFNQDLYNWDMSNVTIMTSMFQDTDFCGDLTGWNVERCTDFTNIFDGTDYVTGIAPMFNWTICGHIAEQAMSQITDGNPGGLYTTISVEDLRVKLGPSGSFLTRWEPSGGTISLPVNAATDVSVAWGYKGPQQSYSDTSDISHTFINNGDNYVMIDGSIGGWNTRLAGGPGDKLKAVYHCGVGLRLHNSAGAFQDCSLMVWKALDAPLMLPMQLDQAFLHCSSLGDASLDSWDVSSVTSMLRMFEDCDSFNGYVSTWDVSNVTTMNSMFKDCPIFNQPLNDWSVHNVVDMCAMFEGCRQFDQDLYKWNVGNVTSMRRMFIFDVSFRGDLTDWDTGSVTDFLSILDCNYLISVNPVFNWSISGGYTAALDDITHGGRHGSYYLAVDSARPGWYRLVPSYSFTSIWDPSAGQVTLPLTGSSDASIAWGDNTGLEAFTGTEPTHTYVRDPTGLKNIVVRGTAQDWNALDSTVPPAVRLKNITRCGPLLFKNTSSAFEGCTKMEWDATDTPRFYHGHTLKRAFYGCVSLGSPNFNNWDVSNVTNMDYTFTDASGFDGSMSDWTTVSINTMLDTFRNTSFNNDIGSWNTSKVSIMHGTFRDTPFNQDLNDWDITNVKDFTSAFQDTSMFNQDLYKWNTQQATDMVGMFSGATAFHGDVTGWDARNVTDFTNIFDNSYSLALNPLFNWLVHQDYSDNALAEVTDDQSGNYILIRDPDNTTLYRIIPSDSFLSKWSIVQRPCFNVTLPTVSAFSDISIDWGGPHEWPTESWHDASFIFKEYVKDVDKTILIRGDLRGWNARYATIPAGSALKRVIYCGGINGPLLPDNSDSAFADCTQMVWDATDTPNLQGITTLETWFQNCASMGAVGSLSSWDISAITCMSGTFMGATTMDCSIDGWNVSSVTTLSNTFNGATAFTQDISTWDVSYVTDMTGTFNGAASFNGILMDWSVHNVTSFEDTFRSTTVFNQQLSDWSMGSAITLAGMFRDAVLYKQSMGNWDISGVTTLNSTFRGATAIVDSDISQWNTESVGDMGYTFTDAIGFNTDLSWNVSNVTNMAGMFSGAVNYRGNMDGWDTSACRDFTNFNLPQGYFDHDQDNPPQFSYYKDGIQTWNVSAAANPGDIVTHDASNNYMYDISNGIITYIQQRLPGIDVGTSVEFSTYHPNVLIPIRPLATNYRMSMITPSGHHYKYDLYSDLSNQIISTTDLINIEDSCLTTLTRDQSYSLLFRLQSKQTDPCAQLILNHQTYDNLITISGSAANVDDGNTGAVDVTYYYTVTETRVNDFFKVSISATDGFDQSFYDFTVFHDESFVTLHTSGPDNSLYEISQSIPLTAGVYAIRIYAENPYTRGPGFTMRLFGVNPADGIPGEALTRYLRDEISKITIMTRRSTMYPH